MKFIRKLFGYSIKKGKKYYQQKGLLEEKSGTKIGQNVIIINRENLLHMKKIFSNFKIKYKILETWIRQ